MKTSIVAKNNCEYFEMPLYWYHMFWKSLYIHEENSQKLAKLIQYEPKHLNFCRQLRAAWLFFVVAYNHIGKVNTITPGASKWAKIKKNSCYVDNPPQPPCSTNYLLISGFRRITGAGLWWAFRQFNQKGTFGSCRCSPSRLQYKNRDKA